MLKMLGLCKRSELDKKDIEILCLKRVNEIKEEQLSKFYKKLIETEDEVNRLTDETKKDKDALEKMEQELLELRRTREEVLKDIHNDLVKTVEEQITELRSLIHERIGLDGKVQQIEVAAAKGKDIVYLSTVNTALNDFRELMLDNIDEVFEK